MTVISKCHLRASCSVARDAALQANSAYMEELDMMARLGMKAEIESVHCHGLHFLADVFLVCDEPNRHVLALHDASYFAYFVYFRSRKL